MFPQFYQNHLAQKLKKSEYLSLKLRVELLQTHKQVSIELLATLMPYPIQFESRRRNLQRFLKLESLQIETLWFPLIQILLKEKFKSKHPLKLAIDRTQWKDKNVFLSSRIWEKRAIPLYGQL